MGTYCDPIRLSDWYEPEPVSPWLEEERKEIDIQRFVDIFEDVLASARPDEVECSLEERFREQADKWDRETAHLSSPAQMTMHPSYQAILGMGRDVVPLLLRDLQQNRRPWFWALSYITNDNPINPADAGRMDKMIKAWVDWGKKRGLL